MCDEKRQQDIVYRKMDGELVITHPEGTPDNQSKATSTQRHIHILEFRPIALPESQFRLQCMCFAQQVVSNMRERKGNGRGSHQADPNVELVLEVETIGAKIFDSM